MQNFRLMCCVVFEFLTNKQADKHKPYIYKDNNNDKNTNDDDNNNNNNKFDR